MPNELIRNHSYIGKAFKTATAVQLKKYQIHKYTNQHKHNISPS